MNLIDIRHHIHKYPEVSGNEKETARYVCERLGELKVDNIDNNFFKEAILAEIDFGKPGKTILFRCELDALPIQETNDDLSYKSVHEGIAHKCGHDGHMTMMLGFAEKLLDNPPKSGRALLLFQPSEEDGRGAAGILNSKRLDQYPIDYVFSLHNIPGYALGEIITKTGSFTPSVESLEVELKGKTSHAGMPENGINPAVAIGQLVNYYQSLHQPDDTQSDYFLATPVQIKMGQPAYGTSAGDGLIGYTFRSYDHDFFVRTKRELAEKTRQIVKKTEGLEVELRWKEGFEANRNDKEAFDLIKKAADKTHLKFIDKERPFSWGEDFGAFTQHYRGAMFGLGSGEDQPELHNPDYDFPDDLLDKGIAMFYQLAKLILT